jgi:predicted Zn finger-like uncharacterized protein
MKIAICAICHRLLEKSAEDASPGAACPACGAVSRVYEEDDNLVRCKRCGGVIYPVPYSYSKASGLCEKCEG